MQINSLAIFFITLHSMQNIFSASSYEYFRRRFDAIKLIFRTKNIIGFQQTDVSGSIR